MKIIWILLIIANGGGNIQESYDTKQACAESMAYHQERILENDGKIDDRQYISDMFCLPRISLPDVKKNTIRWDGEAYMKARTAKIEDKKIKQWWEAASDAPK